MPNSVSKGRIIVLLLIISSLFFSLLIIIPIVRSADQPAAIFTWQQRAPALIDRVEGISAVVDGKLYVFGGFFDKDLQVAAQVDRYDPVTDTWTSIGQMPVPTTHLNPVVDDHTIWFAGGFVGNHPGPVTANVWKYDVINNIWSAGTALPEARAGGALARNGRTLHYFGGFLADRDTTATDHWTLNLDDPLASWQTAAPLPEPLGHQSAITLDGLIYSIGGQLRHDRDPVDSSAVYVYDSVNNSWSIRASLPAPRSHAEPGTFLFNGRIVVVGGRNNTAIGTSELQSVVMYDPPTDTWLALPNLPFTRIAPIAQIFDNYILMTNGGQWWNNPQRVTLSGIFDNSWELTHPTLPISVSEAVSGIVGNKLVLVSGTSTTTLAFDMSADRWLDPAALAPRPLVASGHAVETVGQRLYLFGGSGTAAGKVQLYDPITNAWSLGANMPFAAADSAVTCIGGMVYVAGGQRTGQAIAEVARYDPQSDSWEALPPLPVAVFQAAAASDGTKFYVFGGNDGTGSLNLVQAYDPLTGTWQTSADPAAAVIAMPRPRSGAGRALYTGSAFYLLGGVDATGTPISVSDIYSLADRSWVQGFTLPTPRKNMWPSLIANRVYLAGGTDALAAPSANLEIYNLGPCIYEVCPPDDTPSPTDPAIVGPTIVPEVSVTPLASPSPEAVITPSPKPSATSCPNNTSTVGCYLYLPLLR